MGAAVAAVILMRERRVVEAFERAGATSPDRAISANDVDVDESGVGWRRLRERAIVREATTGRFYLDVEVWQANRRMRHRLAFALGLLLLAALVFGVLGTRSSLQ
jgi:hypothetical protein